MTTWTSAELDKIGTAEELQIESQRADGTLRNPVTIWVVRVDNDLYVRAVKGPGGPWFRGTQVRHAGRIRAGGVAKDVSFAPADPMLHERIDAAYRAKYGHYDAQYVDPTLTPQARTATIKLVPRSTNA